ncbi:S-adenosyl methyltransferase [Saccharothrix saharensis]|uniref:S-adenosyl methyltransferase n=1 Tax=Saccharothrix saharensis TaxID=571190 RepID=A0A543J8I1_9PSEU|nr:SAM-dependent methyltransferase [Saccharothrix saharensis]TQM79114.1 S-adenosyl methyltransferase [Saccharothrix saharensis]
MTDPDRVPADVDTERPSAARVYDYLLGGGYRAALPCGGYVAISHLTAGPDPKFFRPHDQQLARPLGEVVGIGTSQRRVRRR